MSAKAFFNIDHMSTISEALDIAEDLTGGYFKLSSAQWKRHRYSVKTLAHLNHDEIAPDPAFALLQKYTSTDETFDFRDWKRDLYSICLQDHQILNALRRDRDLHMLPLMVYVFTHELIHIVRFCNFFQRFDVKGKDRDREEELVHETSLEALRGLALKNLDYILEAYRPHAMPNAAAAC
jgi:hypothetical protein